MDLWRIGLLRAPLAEVLAAGELDGFEPQWLPGSNRRFAFHADPFGIIRDGLTHIFYEALDYRDRHGRIEVLTLDAQLRPLARAICLEEPWHLSYPALVVEGAQTFMLPEAHRSGGLTLYRAVEFPGRWEHAGEILLDGIAIDATPLWHEGRWWLFYGIARQGGKALHVAFADALRGPWRAHPSSPLPFGWSASRPAGTPILIDGKVVLPVQDCSRTYGGAVRPLRFGRLDLDGIEAEAGMAITPPPAFAPFTDGLHTLSACGDLTLFDAKQFERSLSGRAVGLMGKARRSWRQSRRLSSGMPQR